jgi:hypothetical protein
MAARIWTCSGHAYAQHSAVRICIESAQEPVLRANSHIQRREQGGGAVALVIVRHGAAAALLQRQAGLGAVERLDLALLIQRQHGVGGRIDVKTDC